MWGNSTFFVELALLIVAAIWGINPPIMKIGLQYLDPMTYNSLRMLVAIVVAWVAVGISKTYRPIAKEDIKALLLMSILGFFVFQMCFTIGVQYTTAGNASVLLGMLPVSVAIINRLLSIEQITQQVLVGIGLSIIGVVFTVVGSGKEMSLASDHLHGVLMLLIAQFGYAYYTVLSKPLMTKYSTYQVTATIITISGILFLLVSVPELEVISWRQIPLNGWLSTLYSGIFALCIGNFIWIWGVGKIGSAKSSLYNNLSPVFAILTGYVLLGENFGVLQGAGAIAIFAGIYATRRKKIFSRKKQQC